MTYLEIYQECLVLAGITAVPPASVVGSSGEYAIVLRGIKQAYNDIQSARENWRFMWKTFTPVNTVADQADYDLSSDSVDRVIEDSCTIYKTVAADKSKLTFLPYTDWAEDYGAEVVESDRPQFVTILPDGKLRLTPPPDGIYVLNGDCFRTNHVMALDADEPIFPVKFHPLVVYKGVEKSGKFVQDEFKMAANRGEANELFGQMLWEQLLEEDNPEVVAV